MTIPIRNLYYLFLYAWARFPGGAVGETGIDKSPDLPNLFAKLLSAGTRRLFRRGLDRGYKAFTDELAGPRGRLRLDRMVKETTQRRGTAVCDFDELTHDVLHNQVLKATLTSLAGCSDVEKEIRHDLRSLALVSVYGTYVFWERFGFQTTAAPELADKLKSYGDTGRYMRKSL